MCTARAWPQQCFESCANESNIMTLRFGDYGTKEMFDRFQILRNALTLFRLGFFGQSVTGRGGELLGPPSVSLEPIMLGS